MTSTSRQIFLHGPLGQREIKETLGNLLIGLILSPDVIWLVSPWITDFPLLDNRTRDWDSIKPEWGARYVNFSELLIAVIGSGCTLNLVTTDSKYNTAIIQKITESIDDKSNFNLIVRGEDSLHTKGLLTSSYFLSGGMNFTYTGANKKDDVVTLYTSKDKITFAKLEFEERYNESMD